MEQINNNIKSCATCAYWMGTRKLNRLGFVEIKSKMDTALCADKDLNEDREYQAIYYCRNYYPWKPLDK